jgi:hypothetical protein
MTKDFKAKKCKHPFHTNLVLFARDTGSFSTPPLLLQL